jgi:hypothetical protein
MPAKDHAQALIQEAAASGLPLDRLRGFAFYDMQKDERGIALKSFAGLLICNSSTRRAERFSLIPVCASCATDSYHFVERFPAMNIAISSGFIMLMHDAD